MSISTKIILTLTIIFSLFSSIFSYYFFEREKQLAQMRLKRGIIQTNRLLNNIISLPLYSVDHVQLKQNLESLLNNPNIESIYLKENFGEFELHLKKDLKGLTGNKISSQIDITYDNLNLGTLQTTYTTAYSDERLNRSRNEIIVITLVQILLISLIIGLIIKRITLPIQRLTIATTEIAQGNLDQDIKVTSKDEIGTLSNSFIKMRDSIREKIDDLARVNRHLRQSKHKLDVHIKNTPLGVIELNKELKVVDWNKASENLFGYSREEALGHKMSDIIVADNMRSRIDSKLMELMSQDKGARNINENLNKKRDSITCEWYNTPLWDEYGEVIGVAALVLDITQRIQMESEISNINRELEVKVQERTAELEKSLSIIKETQAQLIENEKLSALGGLVAGVAHEINNPIGVTLTAASFLEESTSHILQKVNNNALKKSDFTRYIEQAGQSTRSIILGINRASDIIQSFKSIAVDQLAEEKRKFNLHQILNDILTSLHHKIKKTKHTVSLNCPKNLEIISYPGVLSQIFTNFIINSLLHGFEDVETGHIQIDISCQDNLLTIDYTDNGHGMSQETLDKVYDPFYTTKRGEGGSGLGMHIVYNQVTKTLNGQIVTRSKEGEGVHFRITFPLLTATSFVTEKRVSP